MKPIYKLSLFILISIFLMITFSCKEAEIEFVDASNPSVQLEKNEISAISGESFTISVTAKVNDEGTLTYQWYRNDENSNSTGTRLAGKTESTFTTSYNLENGELEKIFYYYVVVTNTNNNVNGQKKASATSNLVKVTIIKDDSSGSDGNTDTGGENQGDGNTSTGGENQGDGNTDTGDENQGDGSTGTGDDNQGDGSTGTGDDNQGDGSTGTGDNNQGDGSTGTGDENQGDGNTGTGGENQGDGNTDTGDDNQGDGNTDTGDDNDTETKPDYEISEKSGVMLQGFNWSSAKRGAGYNKENPSPYWYKWYDVVANRGADIGDKFEYLWCPPPSATDTSSSEGYGPTALNDLNNCYGTKDDLTAMIQAIKPTKAIADIVVNHRAGSTSWGDFTNPTWGVVKGSNYAAICSDDEGFTGEPSLMGASSKRGAADTGDGYSAYRDLDHTNTTVQQGIVDWMNNVLKPAGFVGWRYDYVKGFAGEYVGKYNAGSNAEFSVGEYWPTAGYSSGNPSAWGNEIKNWISATASNGGKKSKAFDFALKGAMNTVFGNNASNVANSSYSLLANAANLIMSQPEDAVTFVDNHDTGSTQNHWYLDPADVGTAYAFILTHPGYPCVAWQHYFTYEESGSIVDSQQYIGGNTVPGTDNTYRKHIDYLIDLRNRVGIEYDDKVVTTGTTSSCYVGEIVGNNGTLLVKIGNVSAPTGEGYAGNNPIYSGTNFAIWEKGASGESSGGSGDTGDSGNGGSVTLTATKDVGSGNAVYFTGAFDEAENWTKAVRGTWSDGNVWSVNVTGSSFEWKALVGTYDWGETVTISSQSAWQWESDPNNSYPSTTSSKLQ
ncbi:MAG: hypothetical protein J6K22_07900 [Spirochaetaceae bacterium]|nr:hypothetical protein [Spirochaetaceae bacterium]